MQEWAEVVEYVELGVRTLRQAWLWPVRRRVRQARPRPLEVEELVESGLHAQVWRLAFSTREHARRRPQPLEVEELAEWGVCTQVWPLAKEITGEYTPERGH